MTLTPEQLDEIEAKAKEATPGPWTVSEPASAGLHPRQPSGSAQVRCDEATNRVPSGCLIPYFILHYTDAAHIAANSPDVTLHLVAVYRAALAWRDAKDARQAIQARASTAKTGEEHHAAMRELPAAKEAEVLATLALLDAIGGP